MKTIRVFDGTKRAQYYRILSADITELNEYWVIAKEELHYKDYVLLHKCKFLEQDYFTHVACDAGYWYCRVCDVLAPDEVQDFANFLKPKKA